jgi:hypothetical protein
MISTQSPRYPSRPHSIVEHQELGQIFVLAGASLCENNHHFPLLNSWTHGTGLIDASNIAAHELGSSSVRTLL